MEILDDSKKNVEEIMNTFIEESMKQNHQIKPQEAELIVNSFGRLVMGLADLSILLFPAFRYPESILPYKKKKIQEALNTLFAIETIRNDLDINNFTGGQAALIEGNFQLTWFEEDDKAAIANFRMLKKIFHSGLDTELENNYLGKQKKGV